MANTIKTIDTIQQKLAFYYDTLMQELRRTADDPAFKLDQSKDKMLQLMDDTLRFVRDNELITTPLHMYRGSRFSATLYNDMISSIRVDLLVLFARLKATIDVVNQTASMINSTTYQRLSSIDEMLDKIANLGELKVTNSQFDNVFYNTFVTDDNFTIDKDYKSMHQESGGIIVIHDTYKDLIVERQENFNLYVHPLNTNTVKRMYNDNITATDMTRGLDMSIYSFQYLYTSEYEIGETEEGSSVSISFNGAAVAFIIQLPSIKFVNSLSLKFAAAGLIEIIDMYYSSESAVDIPNYPWRKVDFSIDANNLRGASINFSTIEASSIMLVLGQRSVFKQTIAADMGMASLLRNENFSLSEMVDQIEQNINVVTKDRINTFAKPDVVKTLDSNIANTLNAMISQLESLLPKDVSAPIDASSQNDYKQIYEYNIGLYDLRVEYIHFKDNSVYTSREYGGDGKIADVTITTTDNIPADTTISHYISLSNGLHRILPQSDTVVKDIITIQDVTKRIYDSELLIDSPADPDLLTQRVKLFINNVEYPAWDSIEGRFNLVMQKINEASAIAFGFEIASHINLNFGDTVVLVYQCPEMDLLDNAYNPYTIDIENALGNPILTNQLLTRGTQDRMLTVNRDGSFTSYDIPSESVMKLYPASGETSIPEVAYEVLNGKIKDNPSGAVFPLFDYTTGGGYAVKSEYTRSGSKRIYYGVLDEVIETDVETNFNTDYEYVPGTLHATMQGKPLLINEYSTDPLSYSGHEDKTQFTTNFPVSGTILMSYIPASLDQNIQDSNFASYNHNEEHLGTDQDGALELSFYPHIDRYILSSSLNPGSYWTYSLGTFINKANESITYTPVLVRIDGKAIFNRTDYIEGKDPDPASFAFTGNNIQYYIKGNKLIFNTVVQKAISVSYYALDDSFRLISKMYRTNRKVDDLTPELRGFAIYINNKE